MNTWRTANTPLLIRFLWIFVPLALIIILGSSGIYYLQNVKTHRDILRAQESYSQHLKGEFVKLKLASIISDFKVLAQHGQLVELLEQNRYTNDFTEELKYFSKFKGTYDQIRVLDNTGMEVLRINLSNHEPELVPEAELQTKGDRYYFSEIMSLEKGEVYISRFDLNIEHGEIEHPYKPIIRFGTPLFDQEGEKLGLLVLNYLGNNLLQELDQLSFNSPGISMFLDSDGYWLKARHPDMEWGFMIPDRKHLTMKRQDPDLWERIVQNDSGQYISEDGLATFEKIHPLKIGLVSGDGLPDGSNGRIHYEKSNDRFWVILSQILPPALHWLNSGYIAAMIISDLFLLAFVALFSWKLVVARRKRELAEERLRNLNAELEAKVSERTRQLTQTNQELEHKIEEHERAVKEKNKIASLLQQAQKMEAIGTLAGGVAHDFNNILTPIIINAQMLSKQLDEQHPNQFALEEIIAAARRAKELVQQILTFSRQSEQRLVQLQVQSIIKEALKLLRASLPTTIEIQSKINPDCRSVLADPTQIHQIVMNLCTNAYHAMRDKGGKLSVSLSESRIGPEDYKTHFELVPGTYLKLEISDSGHGIPREIQERIFEPYFTTKPQDEGTGLGLSVVHAIVTKLNGHISVYSEPEIGTTFRIYIPVIDDPYNHPDEPESPEIEGGSGRVLLVEDEDIVRRVMSRVLDRYGYQTTEAANGSEALRIFQQKPEIFDLVITDMTMPGMNGVELIRNIHETRPDLPAILCTGYSETINDDNLHDIGIRYLITKPATIETIAKTVREALDERQAP